LEAQSFVLLSYVDLIGETFQRAFLNHIPDKFNSLTDKEMSTAHLSTFPTFADTVAHTGPYLRASFLRQSMRPI